MNMLSVTTGLSGVVDTVLTGSSATTAVPRCSVPDTLGNERSVKYMKNRNFAFGISERELEAIRRKTAQAGMDVTKYITAFMQGLLIFQRGFVIY